MRALHRRLPGQVSLAVGEINAIAAFLGLGEDDFVAKFTRLNRVRTGLALQDQADGSCVFLDRNVCRIHPVKPGQCRGFPNLWNFPGFEQVCRARPVEISTEEWKARMRESG